MIAQCARCTLSALSVATCLYNRDVEDYSKTNVSSNSTWIECYRPKDITKWRREDGIDESSYLIRCRGQRLSREETLAVLARIPKLGLGNIGEFVTPRAQVKAVADDHNVAVSPGIRTKTYETLKSL